MPIKVTVNSYNFVCFYAKFFAVSYFGLVGVLQNIIKNIKASLVPFSINYQ